MNSFLLQENGFFILLESTGNIILETLSVPRKAITGAVDVALYRQENGMFDIELDDDGDLSKTADIDTAVYMSLLTDKRAASSEVPLPQNQRGWWGNALNADPTYEIGSKLWLLDQSRKQQDALNKAQQWVGDCLEWLVTDKYAAKIGTEASFVDGGIQVKVQFN